MGNTLRIYKSYDDFYRPVLVACIQRPKWGDYPEPHKEDIERLWEHFQATSPDVDSFFGDFLVEQGGWEHVKDDGLEWVIDPDGYVQD